MPVIFMTQFHLDHQRRYEAAQRGIEYRSRYGDPVENLATLLSSVGDSEAWDAVLDDPDVCSETPEASIRAGLEDIAAGRYREITSVADLLDESEGE